MRYSMAMAFLFLATTVGTVAEAQWAPVSTGSADIRNTNTGWVGIGLADGVSPSAPFHLRKTVAGVAFRVDSDLTATSSANVGLFVVPTQKVANTSALVGINAIVDQYGAAAGSGTSDQLSGLDAVARNWDPITVSSAYGARYAVHNHGTGSIVTAYGTLIQDTANDGNGSIGTQYGLYVKPQTHATSNYSIYVEGSTSRSFLAGKVGIGNSNPQAALDVNGNIIATGSITGASVINATYGQDVAEWVASNEPIASGTVVILDPHNRNHVMPSTTAYDTSVAGVVSERPGIVLGKHGDSTEAIATTGRVRVKVDASKGAVAVGDLLVTSDTPGVAMKSQPVEIAGGIKIHRPGTLIGKAIEPLAAGQSQILVLLSLQ